jgi:hypothetical protein
MDFSFVTLDATGPAATTLKTAVSVVHYGKNRLPRLAIFPRNAIVKPGT